MNLGGDLLDIWMEMDRQPREASLTVGEKEVDSMHFPDRVWSVPKNGRMVRPPVATAPAADGRCASCGARYELAGDVAEAMVASDAPALETPKDETPRKADRSVYACFLGLFKR